MRSRIRRGAVLVAAVMASGALAASASAAPFTDTIEIPGDASGTLSNGVGYSVTPANSGFSCNAVQTWTFDREVDLRFGVWGLNAPGEAVQVPEGSVVESIDELHNWNPETRTVSRVSDASQLRISWFTLADTTQLEVTGVGACGWIRQLHSIEVTADVPAPTATVQGPADGSTFKTGDPGTVQFSCTGAIEPVTCTAKITRPDGTEVEVHNGDPLPTDVPGGYTITVTATDGLGQTATSSTAYSVHAALDLCRGTAVRTGDLLILAPGLMLGSANSAEIPCGSDYKDVVGVRVPLTGALGGLGGLLGVNTGQLLQVNALQGLSVDEPNGNGTGATASIAYAKVNVLGITIEVGAVESHARARLDGPGCSGATQYGYSHVANLRINGKNRLTGHQPAKLTLPLGLGAIHVNQTVRQGATLTQRAVYIDLPGTALDIALGESRAGIGCT